jgi:hypothetical protein
MSTTLKLFNCSFFKSEASAHSAAETNCLPQHSWIKYSQVNQARLIMELNFVPCCHFPSILTSLNLCTGQVHITWMSSKLMATEQQ